QPARLGDDPELLTAEADRGLGVQDEPPRRGHPTWIGRVLPAPATATTTAAAPALTARARRLRALDLNGPAVHRRAVELADRLLGVFRGRHLDEPEAARATGVAVGHDGRRLHAADRGADLPEPVVGGREGQAADEEADA